MAFLRPLLLLAALLLVACPDKPIPESCPDVAPWSAGTPAFRDATLEWGLEEVEGIRISVTDLDGDGWPDLLVRNGGGPDDFATGERSRWILRNTGEGTFEDVAESSGLLQSRSNPEENRSGQVFSSGDVDGDGDLDIFVGTARFDGEGETSELMLNDGTGAFSLGPSDSAARFENTLQNPASASFLDHNGDGHLDLWVTHNQDQNGTPMQDTLLQGDGAGGFEDITQSSGLETRPWNRISTLNNARGHSWSWSGAACDLDSDGRAELLAASYGRAPNHLWHAVEDGGETTYENESVDSAYAYDHRVDWSDNMSALCFCADQPSAEDCSDMPDADPNLCASLRAAFGENYRWDHTYDREPFRLGGNSGTTVCADLDNDGQLDLVTHEIVHWDVGTSSDPTEILWNLGDSPPRFERPGNDVTGLLRDDASSAWDHGDMTGAVLDFDNDGWLDIYIGASDYPGNRGLLYRQVSPQEFKVLSVGDSFEHYRSHGVTVADLDRDGDSDLVVGHSKMRCGDTGECESIQQVRLFENLVGQDSGWLQLVLEGTGESNRMAIGAKVEVHAGGVTRTGTVDGGHGHFGMQNESVLTFGLGAACEVEIDVTWPDGENTQHSVDPNARYRVVQGQDPEWVGR